MSKNAKNRRNHMHIVPGLRACRHAIDCGQWGDFAMADGVEPEFYSQWESSDFDLFVQDALELKQAFYDPLDFIYAGRLETLPQSVAKAVSSDPLLNISTTSNID